MRLIVAPILAGEGVLNGLRGEYRRVEDKFMSMNMELKTAQVMFDLTTQHGNRTVCCLCIVSNWLFDLSWSSLNKIETHPGKVYKASTCLHTRLPWRSMPQLLQAWMVVLDTTLGSKLGTLYKAPRNSERDLKDTNAWTKNTFWNIGVCKPSVPLAPSHWPALYCFYFLHWVWIRQ